MMLFTDIKEDLLYYLWQYQFFNKNDLKTTDGKSIQIIKNGTRNDGFGADFSQSTVIIDDIEWIGNVEIHVKTSDWYLHRHDSNQSYDSVILHVVFENDEPFLARTDGTLIPCLELKDRVEAKLLENYFYFKSNKEIIPCAMQIKTVRSLQKNMMIDKAQTQRLQRKSDEVLDLLKEYDQDWEQLTFSLIAQSLGMKQNKDQMRKLAELVPISILRKCFGNEFQCEAMLLGQSGLIETNDDYSKRLNEEYLYLKTKFNQLDILSDLDWKHARLRPASNPVLRIVSLAHIYAHNHLIFSKIISEKNITKLKAIFEVSQPVYWQAHFDFGKTSKTVTPKLGVEALNLLIINTVVPILAAYSRFVDDSSFLELAIELLNDIPAENNFITRNWKLMNLKSLNAFESQGLIELYNEFCMKKKCLNCGIGIEILGKD